MFLKNKTDTNHILNEMMKIQVNLAHMQYHSKESQV